MKKILLTKIGAWLLFFGGPGNVSAAQGPELPNPIPVEWTVQEATDELVMRINDRTDTFEYIRACLDFGVDPDTTVNDNQTTLLMIAVMDANVPVAQLLFEYGADPDIVDVSGNNALSYVPTPNEQRGDVDNVIAIIDLLWQRGADLDRPNNNRTALLSKMVSCERALSELVARNVNLNIQDRLGRTPLMHSVSVHPGVTKKLVASGANLNMQDDAFIAQERTALMLAAYSHRLENMKELIFAGANPLLKDKHGLDALALFKNPVGNINNARLSVQRKAEVDAMQKLLGLYCEFYEQHGKDIARKKVREQLFVFEHARPWIGLGELCSIS